MKQIAEFIYARRKRRAIFVRRRIPAAIRAAYPPKQLFIQTNMRTSDVAEGKRRARVKLTRIDAEFAE